MKFILFFLNLFRANSTIILKIVFKYCVFKLGGIKKHTKNKDAGLETNHYIYKILAKIFSVLSVVLDPATIHEIVSLINFDKNKLSDISAHVLMEKGKIVDIVLGVHTDKAIHTYKYDMATKKISSFLTH